MSDAHELLRRLIAGDERYVSAVLAAPAQSTALDRRTRDLVRLAALLVLDAPTASVRVAVERACATGATDDALVAVLTATAPDTGGVQLVRSAARLALALDLDPDLEGWEGI